MKTKMHSGGLTSVSGEVSLQQQVDCVLRVDLAGEWGAQRIYEGQLWALQKRRDAASVMPLISHMYEQELSHVHGFEKWARSRHTRPTLLAPLWHVGAWILGAGTGLLGTRAAMACTVAVEHVIDEHYRNQIEALQSKEPDLCIFLEECRQDEVEHHDQAFSFIKDGTPILSVLSCAIRGVTRLAIKMSEIL